MCRDPRFSMEELLQPHAGELRRVVLRRPVELTGRYLSFTEREEIALLRAQDYSMQEVAEGSGGQRRRSHGNCGAMLPLEAAVWSTARQQRNGTQSDPLAGQRRGSCRSTRHCEPMWRSGWLAPSSLRAGHLCPAQRCPGKVVDMGGGRTAGGQMLGAQNRSPAGSRSTFRTMRPCASAMKQSIKRCSFKDEARCGAS